MIMLSYVIERGRISNFEDKFYQAFEVSYPVPIQIN